MIELLVVCGIMVVVGAIIFSSNSKFGGQVLLQNLAYDVALSVRQAQVYGISVQRFGGGGTGFSYGYGMHFDVKTPYSYDLFADFDQNGLYDPGAVVGGAHEDVPPSPYSIGRGYAISNLCSPAGADLNCKNGTPVSKLDIVFVRPEPDAWISAGGLSCTPANTAQCQPSARIILKSPRGDRMSISVFANGQIAVDQTAVIQK